MSYPHRPECTDTECFCADPEQGHPICDCGAPGWACTCPDGCANHCGQDALPDSELCAECAAETEYLILDLRNPVENCALFWAPDAKGYTSDLRQAGRYSREYATSCRDTDIPVPRYLAERASVTHVRLDRLRDYLALERRRTVYIADRREQLGIRTVDDDDDDERQPCSRCSSYAHAGDGLTRRPNTFCRHHRIRVMAHHTCDEWREQLDEDELEGKES